MKPLIAFASLVVLAAGCLLVADAGTRASQGGCGARTGETPGRCRAVRARRRLAPTCRSCPRTSSRRSRSSSQAGWIMDALFLRQVWAGNEGMLLNLLTDRSPLGQARTHYFLINKGPWDRLDHNAPFIAGAPAKPEGANFYPAGATQGRHRGVAEGAAGGGARAGDGLLHDHPAAGGREGRQGRLRDRALQRRVPGRAGACRRAAARGGRPDGPAHAEGVPDEPRGRLPQQRLLRERRGVDGARREHRADDRARTRSTRTSGSTPRPASRRSSRSATTTRRRSWRSWARSCRGSRTTCRSTRSCAIRSSAGWRPSASSTSCSPRATAIAACRRRPSICRTTSGW